MSEEKNVGEQNKGATKLHAIRKHLKERHGDLKRRPPSRLKQRIMRKSRKKQKRQFFVILGIYLFACLVAFVLIYEHYHLYPGLVDRDSIRATERGTDYIDVSWDKTRNTKDYKIYVREHRRSLTEDNDERVTVDDSWDEYTATGESFKIDKLKEGTSYSFAIRADSEYREGLSTQMRNFKTKSNQTIRTIGKVTKLTASKPFKIKAEAETALKFESSDENVAKIDNATGEIVLTGAGTAEITVIAEATDQFEEDKTKVELKVLDSKPVKAGGARAHTIYHLDSDNCDVVKTVTGANGHVIPQAFGYSGDKYWIAYGMSGQGRIVTYPVDGEGEQGKEVIAPKIALSHPNGFTYADENKTCYSVRGWSSRAVTYNTETGEFGTMNFRYGCSGIGYDRKEKKMYTSSRTLMASYDITDGFSVANTCGVVKHSGSMATQDIGGHAGIMLRCLSPNGRKHGINYIDLYDMRNGTYLGSFSCDLSEVESAIVDNEGYLEILANNTKGVDYIWKTDLNIETLAEGLE